MAGSDENPLTEEEMRRSAEAAMEALARARELYGDEPVENASPGKFTDPVGFDDDGNQQPPLSPEEAAHNDEVRRRGQRAVAGGEDDQSDEGHRGEGSDGR